jgi:SOS-response transcriptional repressor LexA
MIARRPGLTVDQKVRHDTLVHVRRAEQGLSAQLATPAQVDVVLMIRAFVAEHGYSPTLREIADATECTFSTASFRVGELRRKGYLTWNPGSPRTIVLTNRAVEPEPITDPCTACHGTGRASESPVVTP